LHFNAKKQLKNTEGFKRKPPPKFEHRFWRAAQKRGASTGTPLHTVRVAMLACAAAALRPPRAAVRSCAGIARPLREVGLANSKSALVHAIDDTAKFASFQLDMDIEERSGNDDTFSFEVQSSSSKIAHPKDALVECDDMPVVVRSFDGEEETFLALKQLEAEREVQVSGCFQKYVSFRPYIVAWIYDTCSR
jgi:hypothetical protein